MFKKNLKIIMILAIIAGIFLGLKLLNNSSLSLVSSVPENNNEQADISSSIKIVFDKTIVLENWQINPSPDFLFQTKIQGKNLEIIPEKPLEADTAYRVEITNKKYPRFSFTLNFKTAVAKVETPQITPAYTYEQTKKYYDDWSAEIHKNQPLTDFLPYKTKNLYIYYIKAFTLMVLAKGDTPQLKKEVNDWILSKKVDPTTHTIKWEVRSTLPN